MIRLYKTDITDISDNEYRDEYALLDSRTAAAVDATVQKQGKMQTLAGRILLRRAVRELFGINEYTISYGDKGKPMLPFCFFSISHSASLVILAVSDCEIGADAERIRPIKQRNTYKLLSAAESQSVNQSSCPECEFMRIWTCKEAMAKCVGVSVSQASSLNKADFDFSLEQYRDYIIAVCTKHTEGEKGS